MISRYLARRRDRAASAWLHAVRLARLLNGSPVSNHADNALARARRRLARWDALLDLWTLNGTR